MSGRALAAAGGIALALASCAPPVPEPRTFLVSSITFWERGGPIPGIDLDGEDTLVDDEGAERCNDRFADVMSDDGERGVDNRFGQLVYRCDGTSQPCPMPSIDDEIRSGGFVLAIHLPDVSGAVAALDVEVGLARPEGCDGSCALALDGESVLVDQAVVRDEMVLDATATRDGDRITVRIARIELPASVLDDDERGAGQVFAVDGLTLSFDLDAAQQESDAGGGISLGELERFYTAIGIDEAAIDTYLRPQLDLGDTACEAMSIGFRMEVTRVTDVTR